VSKYDGARADVRLLVAGYNFATRRFEAAGSDQDRAFFAVFEALNWATALDDVIGEIWRPKGGDAMRRKWREEVPGAEVLAGIRYVRNRVHHQWAWALDRSNGTAQPFPPDMWTPTWSWADIATLPTPDERPDEYGRKVYVEQLAGQPVQPSLFALRPAFVWVGQMLEPPRAQSHAVEDA
jgi:hypothetical protein